MSKAYLSHLSVPPSWLLSNLQNLTGTQVFGGSGFLKPYTELTEYPEFNPKYLLVHSPITTTSGPISRCLDDIRHSLHPTKATTDRFTSGWCGLIEYPKNPNQEPLGHFSHYTGCILIDPEQHYILALSYSPEFANQSQIDFDNLKSKISTTNTKSAPKVRSWTPGFTKPEYLEKYAQVEEYLKSGDCYQVNLAMPFHCKDDLTLQNPLPLLETFNAPFSFYMKTADRSVFSVTPERFISIRHNQIETRPIKGTAPRSADSHEDLQLAEGLKASLKNQAENLMIVDLLRNDLSRSAKPDSVKVEKLFELETHTNVHHLVSTISAEKRDDLSPTEVIRSAFPGGSITGAPKRRAMEIIHELETESRGAYCGSAGFFDAHGYTDFNILIRTISARKEGATCWGGGGIVIDSTAEEEYQEIFNKVQKILNTPL